MSGDADKIRNQSDVPHATNAARMLMIDIANKLRLKAEDVRDFADVIKNISSSLKEVEIFKEKKQLP